MRRIEFTSFQMAEAMEQYLNEHVFKKTVVVGSVGYSGSIFYVNITEKIDDTRGQSKGASKSAA